MNWSLIGGSPPPSHVFTSASIVSPELEPMRIRLGRRGVNVPASPIRSSSRCSM
jgi:hypothetical protein